MPATTPEQRSLVASIAAHSGWAKPGSKERRRAQIVAQYELLADPDGVMSPEERAEAGQHLLKAQMARVSLKGGAAFKRKAAELAAAQQDALLDAADQAGASATPPTST
jgi:hypothetical protein